MKADIVIGANLGDEGKGIVVATLTKNGPYDKVLNILTNGGAQRAHSILTDVGNFTFQHFGSGTYYGAYNYFSEFFILNPMQFAKERKELENRGVKPFVCRNFSCRWSTPFDMMANAIIESLRGDKKHGSCGMGIWETTVRYNDTNKTMPFDNFLKLSEEKKIEYLQSIKKYYEDERIKAEIPFEWRMIWNNMNLIYNFICDCEYMQTNTHVVFNLYDAIQLCQPWELIFENGQGLMLSDTGKDIAGTTPSLTGCDYAARILASLPENIIFDEVNLHYVSRTYLTRHGRGQLDNEMERSFISGDLKEDRTNHYNEFQESFRYGEMTSEVLTNMYQYIMKDAEKIKHNKLILDLTHCDEVDKEAECKKLFENVVTYDSALIK